MIATHAKIGTREKWCQISGAQYDKTRMLESWRAGVLLMAVQPTDPLGRRHYLMALGEGADAGAIWDNEATTVTDLVRKRGNAIASLPEESVKSWRKAVEPIYDAWTKQISARGHNGQELLESARELIAKHEST